MRNNSSPISYTVKIILAITVAMSIIGLFLSGGMVLSSGSLSVIAIIPISLVIMGAALVAVFLLFRKQPIQQLQ